MHWRQVMQFLTLDIFANGITLFAVRSRKVGMMCIFFICNGILF